MNRMLIVTCLACALSLNANANLASSTSAVQAPAGYTPAPTAACIPGPRDLSCDGAFLENLPPHSDPVADQNGACNSIPYMAQPAYAHICGTLFTYVTSSGNNFRDLDWYEITLTETTTLTVYAETETVIPFYATVYGNSVGTLDCSVPGYDLSSEYESIDGIVSYDITLNAGQYWLLLGLFGYGTDFPDEIAYSVTLEGLPAAPPVASADPVAGSFGLSQNYPNPFNPTTAISFSLPETEMTQLKVYNLNGSLVSTLANGLMESGQHTVSFDAANLPSGTYFYRLQSGRLTETRKMVLVR